MLFGPSKVKFSTAVLAALFGLGIISLGLSRPAGGAEVEIWAFSASWCGACRQMEPTLAQLESEGMPLRRIDVQRQPEVVRQFGIQALPTFLAMKSGRPVGRIVGATNRENIRRLYECASKDTPFRENASPPNRETSSRQIPSGGLEGWHAGQSTSTVPVLPTTGTLPLPGTDTGPASRAHPSSTALPAGSISTSAAINPPPEGMVWAYARTAAELLLATARLRIRDSRGQSCGSGTIVDARAGEALILTCGHIFRDSKGQGAIEVDLFGPQPAEKLPGRLLAYDLQRDLGLLVIRPPGPVVVARIAPQGTRLAPGLAVISVGCDHGSRPTARFSRVTAVDKYVGPANVVISGMPVEGRSGGGLFTEEGFLIGVCNAADPKDGEGLFAALPAIHELLVQKNLAFVYKDPPPAAIHASQVQLAGQPSSTDLTPAHAPASPPPAKAELSQDREASFSSTGGTPIGPIASAGWELPSQSPSASQAPQAEDTELSPAEEALLATLARRIHEGAELLWVVKPRQATSAQGEVVSFDRLSPAFLARLAELTRSLPRRTSFATAGDPPEASSAALPSPPPPQGRVLLEFRSSPRSGQTDRPLGNPAASGWGPGRNPAAQP
jgi:thiol-disulfide isomerase/thioredoxin